MGFLWEPLTPEGSSGTQYSCVRKAVVEGLSTPERLPREYSLEVD